MLWDEESWDVLSTRQVRLARETGALDVLPMALTQRAGLHLFRGEVAEAATLLEEIRTITEATRGEIPLYGPIALEATRGRLDQACELVGACTRNLVLRGEGAALTYVHWATALLHNGLGRYKDALAAVRQCDEDPLEQVFAPWAALELIEAAVRSGVPEDAADALERLTASTRAAGTDWALGTECRARALLSDGESAERLYREALDRLGRTRIRMALARTHLLYGEWLRRERRRTDAREQLRTAQQMFAGMGADGFAERSERELLASGETARKRTVVSTGQLTPQEAQVARLARDGLSNPEIGARLFISSRTVQYHLHKVFTKLGISSRMQLDRVLPGDHGSA